MSSSKPEQPRESNTMIYNGQEVTYSYQPPSGYVPQKTSYVSSSSYQPQTYYSYPDGSVSAGAPQSYSQPSIIPPGVQIDEKIVKAQENKALKELEARVNLASSQQAQMYAVQKEHITTDAARQLDLTRSAINAQKQQMLMQLEMEFAQNNMGIDHASQHQRFQIEQTAMSLDIQALQQKMIAEHQAAERKWNSTNSLPNVGTAAYSFPQGGSTQSYVSGVPSQQQKVEIK